VRDPAFTAEDGVFGVYTDWIETGFDNTIPPYSGELGEPEEALERSTVVVEVNGRRLEVKLPSQIGVGSTRQAKPKKPPKRAPTGTKLVEVGGNSLTAPMQGTIVKTAVNEGDEVSEGDLVLVLEAMKMEQPISAHRSGTIRQLVTAGATVASGDVLCEIVSD